MSPGSNAFVAAVRRPGCADACTGDRIQVPQAGHSGTGQNIRDTVPGAAPRTGRPRYQRAFPVLEQR